MIRVAMKSRPSRREYSLAAQLLRENNEKVEAKVAEVEAWSPEQVSAAQTEILAAKARLRKAALDH
jgi:predicted  nucleic acid-binding Zn-ribbon protein